MKPGPQNSKTWRCKCGTHTVVRRPVCFRCGALRCERCEGTGFDGSGEPCQVCA